MTNYDICQNYEIKSQNFDKLEKYDTFDQVCFINFMLFFETNFVIFISIFVFLFRVHVIFISVMTFVYYNYIMTFIYYASFYI